MVSINAIKRLFVSDGTSSAFLSFPFFPEEWSFPVESSSMRVLLDALHNGTIPIPNDQTVGNQIVSILWSFSRSDEDGVYCEVTLNDMTLRICTLTGENLYSEIQSFNMDMLFSLMWPDVYKRNPYKELVIAKEKDSKKIFYLFVRVMKINNRPLEEEYWSLDDCWTLLQNESSLASGSSSLASSSQRSGINGESLQVHFLASLLSNPSCLHESSLRVHNDGVIYSDSAYTDILPPILRTRKDIQRYELRTMNILYIREFDRVGRRNLFFLSDFPLSDSILSPILEEDYVESKLLVWSSYPTVRSTVKILGNNERSSYPTEIFGENERDPFNLLDHFVSTIDRIRELHDRFRVEGRNFSFRELIQELQPDVFEFYNRVLPYKVGNFQYREYDEVNSMIYLREHDDLRTLIRDDESLLQYHDFFLPISYPASFIFDSKMARIIREGRVGLCNKVAEDYKEKFQSFFDGNGVYFAEARSFLHGHQELDTFWNEFFQVLSNRDASPDLFLYALHLGFDINWLVNGKSLLHCAVEDKNCDKVRNLLRVPTILLDIKDRDAKTSLDILVQNSLNSLQNEENTYEGLETDLELFRVLVMFNVSGIIYDPEKCLYDKYEKFGAGTCLQNPHNAHSWYMKVLQHYQSSLPDEVKEAFRKLARRNQSFRWLVVLEEIFPQQGRGDDLMDVQCDLPSSDGMIVEIIQKLRERDQIRDSLVADNFQLFENDENGFRERYRKSIICQIFSICQIPADPNFSDLGSAVIYLNLENKINEESDLGNRLRLAIRELDDELYRLMERDRQRQYDELIRDQIRNLHAIVALQLQTLENVEELAHVGSISSYYAPRLLLEYLEYITFNDRDQEVRSLNFSQDVRYPLYNTIYQTRLIDKLRVILNNDPLQHMLRILPDVYSSVIGRDTYFRTAENGVRMLTADSRHSLFHGGVLHRWNRHGVRNVQKLTTQGRPESLLDEEGILFIKEYPQFPGLEAACRELVLGFVGEGVPYSDVACIDGKPYLISQGFYGDDLRERMQDLENLRHDLCLEEHEESARLNEFLLINIPIALAHIIVSREDGKFENFVLEKVQDSASDNVCRIISVDNDHCLIDPIGNDLINVADDGHARRLIQTNSIIYAMKHIMTAPLPISFVEILKQLDVDYLMKRWLQSLQSIQENLENLFDNPHHRRYMLNFRLCCLELPISEKMIAGVWDRLSFLSELVKNDSVKTLAEVVGRMIPILATEERYGRFWNDGAEDFLEDNAIRNIYTSSSIRFLLANNHTIGLHYLSPDNAERIRAIVERITNGMEGMKRHCETEIRVYDDINFDVLPCIRISTYQMKRFLGCIPEGIHFPEERQQRIIDLLRDPNNSPVWLSFSNFSKLCSSHFDFDHQPEGRELRFVIRNLYHLRLCNCEQLDPGFFERLLHFFYFHPVHLDLSCCNLPEDIVINERIGQRLKTLILNGVRSTGRARRIEIYAPFLEELEIEGFVDPISTISIHCEQDRLRRLSLKNMERLADDIFNGIIFQTDQRNRVMTENNGNPILRFKNLESVDVTGTRVTNSSLRGYLFMFSSNDIRLVRERIEQSTQAGTPLEVLETLFVNVNDIVSARGFFNHVGQFFKNVIIGLAWDLRNFGRLIWRMFCWIFRRREGENDRVKQILQSVIPDVTYQFVDDAVNDGLSSSSFLADVATVQISIREAMSASSLLGISSIASIVGISLSGALWIARAAYWEHKRVKQSIFLAQTVAGSAICSILMTLNNGVGVPSNLDLRDKNLGDVGLMRILEGDEPIQWLRNVSTIDLRGNLLTDKSERVLRYIKRTLPNLHIKVRDNNLNPRLVDELEIGNQIHDQQEQVENIFEDYDEYIGGDPRGDANSDVVWGLSLDGGGMKGLLTAVILQNLCRSLGGRSRFFNVFKSFAGTSVGGIMALALANGRDPTTFVGLFENDHERIFRPNSNGLLEAKYSPQGIESILQEMFGDRKLSSIKEENSVVVPAVRTDRGTLLPYLFDSSQVPVRSSDFFLRDVARATSSAPTFFPKAVVQDLSEQRNRYSFWDGGIWKNNPSELLFMSMRLKFPDKRIKILSIGTGKSLHGYDILGSLPEFIQPIIDIEDGRVNNIGRLIYGQMDLSSNIDDVMQHALDINPRDIGYIRIQPSLLSLRRHVELDARSEDLLERYKDIALQAWEGKKALVLRELQRNSSSSSSLSSSS